jgi:hypothetical protein
MKKTRMEQVGWICRSCGRKSGIGGKCIICGNKVAKLIDFRDYHGKTVI